MVLLKNYIVTLFKETSLKTKKVWSYLNRPINDQRLMEIEDEKRKFQFQTNLKL